MVDTHFRVFTPNLLTSQKNRSEAGSNTVPLPLLFPHTLQMRSRTQDILDPAPLRVKHLAERLSTKDSFRVRGHSTNSIVLKRVFISL